MNRVPVTNSGTFPGEGAPPAFARSGGRPDIGPEEGCPPGGTGLIPPAFSLVLAAAVMLLLPGGSAGWMSKSAPALPPPSGPVVRVSTVAGLEDAVARISSGETIVVEPGTYRLTRTLVFDGVDSVAIRGATGDRSDVILAGRGMTDSSGKNTVPHVIAVQNVADMLIADLTLTGAWYHNVHMAGSAGPLRPRMYNVHSLDCGEQHLKVNPGYNPTAFPDSGIVEHCRFEFTDRAKHDYTNGVDILDGAGWIVRDCEFVRIRGPVGVLSGPAVLCWHNCLGTVVERCLFYECDFGVTFGLDSGLGASKRDPESAWDHQGGIIRNNVIYRASYSADIGISVNRARDFNILHNTVLLNGTFGHAIEYRWDNSSGLIANNLTDCPIWRRNGAEAELAGNITSAAVSWFVDADSADLHIRENCPAVDAAEALEWVEKDFDGDSRPADGVPDVGADEWTPPPERGDLNRDSRIDIFDLLELLAAVVSAGDAAGEQMDLDGSGRIDIFDLLELLNLLRA